jgi:RHS repeat-associated protein
MWTTDEITFWSVTGQKLATYQIVITGGLTGVGSASAPTQMYASQTGTNYYFGRKLIKNAGGYVGADRLGSIGHFYPYGQEKPSATTNGTEKFTGYFRDAETGNDYAINRYHLPGTGRFLTPDPYANSAGPTDPGSWNRYAYTRGDPVNRIDLRGLDDNGVGELDDTGDDGDDSFGGGGPVNYTNGDTSGTTYTCSNGASTCDPSEMVLTAIGPGTDTGPSVSVTSCPSGETLMNDGTCDAPIYGPLGQGTQILIGVYNQTTYNLALLCYKLRGINDLAG